MESGGVKDLFFMFVNCKCTVHICEIAVSKIILTRLTFYDRLWTFHAMTVVSQVTRKPCYRKENRTMCPVYGCPEKFRESLATPAATFPEIVNGLLL